MPRSSATGYFIELQSSNFKYLKRQITKGIPCVAEKSLLNFGFCHLFGIWNLSFEIDSVSDQVLKRISDILLILSTPLTSWAMRGISINPIL
jgi:hypothetical protein